MSCKVRQDAIIQLVIFRLYFGIIVKLDSKYYALKYYAFV